jgi:NAD(P)-dependent dehydrogenase (short-subunit alcohol dehydrogenase family)
MQINNAGISMPGAFHATADGFEQTLATNFFGPCFLTLLLQVGGAGRREKGERWPRDLLPAGGLHAWHAATLRVAPPPHPLLAQDHLMASAPARVVNMSSIEEQLTDVFSDIDWCVRCRAR